VTRGRQRGNIAASGEAYEKYSFVEDQYRIGTFLKQALLERSYAVTWARSCGEASDALCESSHDAIILDLGWCRTATASSSCSSGDSPGSTNPS